MNGVILYGSHYGSARRYAQALAESTGIVAVPYANAPQLAGKHTIVYVGALYAGGVLGLSKTFRGFPRRKGRPFSSSPWAWPIRTIRKTAPTSAPPCSAS